jgi:hypothetical protein
MRTKWVIAFTAAVLLPLTALAQANSYYDRSYTRMSYVQGDVYVQRAQNQGYEQGQINLVVVEGDKLGTKSGRLEVQLGRGNYLRLDAGSQVDMAGLPTADGQPTKLHILAGSAYIRVASMDLEKNFEIHTPDGSFYVLKEGLYRVDVRASGETGFRVYEGAAEGAGQDGSIVIEEGQSVSAADGRFSSSPASLVAQRDDFSAWNDTRDAVFARRSTSNYLPADYADYETELDSYGSWVDESDYGNVWVPRGVDASWRPYSNGRWVWYPIIGWTWVSNDPWGWSTYHYGRWGWGANLGWYWIPRNHWSWGPAWVDWWGSGDYYGWCPLSYWDRPAYIWNNVFYGRYDRFNHRDFRGFDRSMTMVRRDQLHSRNIRDVAIGPDRIGGRMNDINFRGGRPGFGSPGRGGDAGINARASATFSDRGARSVDHGFAGNGTRLSSSDIRSSNFRGGDAGRGSGSQINRLGGNSRIGNSGQTGAGRFQSGDTGMSSRSSSSRLSGSSMREYPSSSGRMSSPGFSSPSASRNYSSPSNTRSYSSPSGNAGMSPRSSSSRLSGSSMREYPSSSGRMSSSGSSSPSTSRNYSSPSNTRSYSSPSSTRSYTSPSSTRSYSSPSSSRNYSSPSSTRSYTSPSSTRSYSSPSSSRNYSSPSNTRSYTSPSSSRSYSSPSSSRNYSSPSNTRSYSSPSSSRSYSSPSSSRSYSAPSGGSSSSSRTSGGSSRSSSGGGMSRGGSGSGRSSGGGSGRR